jgi:hypothetical protein
MTLSRSSFIVLLLMALVGMHASSADAAVLSTHDLDTCEYNAFKTAQAGDPFTIGRIESVECTTRFGEDFKFVKSCRMPLEEDGSSDKPVDYVVVFSDPSDAIPCEDLLKQGRKYRH